MMFDTFLFDLDGTVVDSAADLRTAINLLRTEMHLGPLDLPTVRRYVGDGARMLVTRALPEGEFSEERLRLFLDYYRAHLVEQTRPYPGITDFLAAHDPERLAIVTNKPYQLSIELLDGLGLRSRFAAIVGGDSCPAKKPDPAPVREALRLLGADPRATVMIGDHHTDLHAGLAAGLATCFCAWGIGHDGGVSSRFRARQPTDLLRLFPPGAAL